MKRPSFQFYPCDWLSDPNVISMTATERGAYIQLLATMWTTEECQLKDDQDYLSRVAQVDKVVITSIYHCFKQDNGFIKHKRLDTERNKQDEYRNACSLAGKKGMTSRWKGDLNQKTLGRNKVVITKHNSSSSSSSSTPTPTSNKEERGAVDEIVNVWNSTSLLPKCLSVTDKRIKLMKLRMLDEFFNQHWREALEKLKCSDFCTGKNDRGWKADIDWFLKPDSVPRIMEGKYDGKKKILENKPF